MTQTFAGLVDRILELINVLVPAVLGLVLVYLTWKVIDSWVVHGGDQTKREEGKQAVLLGTIVFVLMVVIWGVITILRTTLFG